MQEFKPETIEKYKKILDAGGAKYVGRAGKQKLIAKLSCGHHKEIWTTVLAGGQTWMPCRTCQTENAVNKVLENTK